MVSLHKFGEDLFDFKQVDFAVSIVANFIEQFLLCRISRHHQSKQEPYLKLPSWLPQYKQTWHCEIPRKCQTCG